MILLSCPIIILLCFIQPIYTSKPRVFGYLPEYRLSDDVDFDGIFSSGVTDLIFFSVEVGYLGIIEQKQRLPSPALLDRARAAADAHGAHLLVSIGGAGRSAGFPEMVAHNGDVRRFIGQMDDMINKYKLDGIDINWEAPQNNAHWKNLKYMLRWARVKFRRKSTPVIITLPYHPGQEDMIKKHKLSKQCDYFLAMSYEHPVGGGPTVARTVVEAWRERGLDTSKLALGIPFYGRNKVTGEPETYAEISKLSNPSEKFVYDSPADVEGRTRYAIDEGLAGVMVWELGQDLPPSDPSCLLSAICRIVLPLQTQVNEEGKSDGGGQEEL
ncbi:chitinase [Perkinsus chesapeaki]|uniref:Chitinase n=1 Tax=Perkinsus chesapeaki TaxID=330153 RepID=A0A7J6LV05_PERCH|nr:chitinase [Perkinsus chesapeaki]